MMRILAGTVLLLLLVTGAAAQEEETPIVIKSCDGNITITSDRVCMRGYEFLPVGCVDGMQIRLAATDGSAEAVLDISSADSLCFTIIEGNMRMRVNCCWKRVFIGSEAVMAKDVNSRKRHREVTAMIHHTLKTDNVEPQHGGF